MIRRPPRSTQSRSSAASDVYKRQPVTYAKNFKTPMLILHGELDYRVPYVNGTALYALSLIHISEPTRLLSISYAVFCLKKKKHHNHLHNVISTLHHPNYLLHTSTHIAQHEA